VTFYKNSYFEWDETKNLENINKHGISFEEAMTVFDDDNALYKSDVDHSEDEERFIILGLSVNPRLLVVCHCYRESEAVNSNRRRTARRNHHSCNRR